MTHVFDVAEISFSKDRAVCLVTLDGLLTFGETSTDVGDVIVLAILK